MTLRLSGVHHVSAVSAHISRSHDFYTRVLGMRPVIRTVNQDDPTMYHLFYGDGVGTPGSDMTVFDIPGAVRETRGNNSITKTTFRVAGDVALRYWVDRLDALAIPHSGIATRDDRNVIDFDDPEGTQLSLIDDRGAGDAFPWAESPVPAEYQIRGLGYTMMTVPQLDQTQRFLTAALGLSVDRAYSLGDVDVTAFAIGDGGAHAEVHVVVDATMPRGRHGAGGVHHFALRVPEGQSMDEWVAKLDGLGYSNSGIVDRHYFTSIYVREPGHVLIELATDGPGFEVDGPLDGERLSLPPFLEPRRSAIEANLSDLP